MPTELLVALIAAAVAVGTVVVNAVVLVVNNRRNAERDHQLEAKRAEVSERLARLNADLTAQNRLAELRQSARQAVDRHREPLLRVSLDLAGRLDNIRHEKFTQTYLYGDRAERATRRRSVARASTFYLCARYWYIVDHLERAAPVEQFKAEGYGSLVERLGDIGHTFATDSLGSDFMVWREEQRAVAELMHAADQPAGYIGFATFMERLSLFEPWFAGFAALEQPGGFAHQRLKVLQQDLVRLITDLDTSDLYADRRQGLSR